MIVWNLMVLKAKLECYLMRLKVGDKGGARDIFPTIPGPHSPPVVWYLARNAAIEPPYSMSRKLRRKFTKSATVIVQLAHPTQRETRTKKVRVALFSIFPSDLRVYRILCSFRV